MTKHCIICNQELDGQKQKFCSNKCKQKEHYHRLKHQTNTYHSQTMRALKRKLDLMEMMGGKCISCGYDKNISALHFHHRDYKVKKFKLDLRVLSNKRWKAILEEAQKCDILCANCHSEVHNPELSLKNVRRITHGASRRKRRDEQGVNSGKS